MRHKGERNIPDFSHRKKEPHGVTPGREAPRTPSPNRAARTPKPHATSAKSGRRGQ